MLSELSTPAGDENTVTKEKKTGIEGDLQICHSPHHQHELNHTGFDDSDKVAS